MTGWFEQDEPVSRSWIKNERKRKVIRDNSHIGEANLTNFKI